MNVKELFRGIAVIIDDEIHDSKASIYNVLNQLKKKAIPYVEYEKLPNEKIIYNLQNVSFILLDWKLNKSLSSEEVSAGIRLPSGIEQTNDDSNIEFLRKIQKQCFCPIFIFTDEDVDSIILKLKRAKLYKQNACNNILVKSKSDFKLSGSLFSSLEKWLKENASIYLQKEWDNAYQSSKVNLFMDFQKRTSNWVKILWKTYEGDGVNPSIELGDFLANSITTQMIPLELNGSVFEGIDSAFDTNELKTCLERQCYVQNGFLDSKFPGTGDVFELKNEIYINIRPCCDLISRDDTPIDKVELYLLKAERIKKTEAIIEYFDEKYGHFKDNDTFYLIYPACDGYLLKIKFRDLQKYNWKKLKKCRKGRILSPYITKLQMKYSYYLQRQGFPKIPNELLGLQSTLKEEKI